MLDHALKDVVHQVEAQFALNRLPTAKPDAPYLVRPKEQPVLTLDDVATKAAIYGLRIAPGVIKEGLTTGFELMMYLIADGYRINTPLFNAFTTYTGAYTGNETALHADHPAKLRLRANRKYDQYVADKVRVRFTGIIQEEAWVTSIKDVTTGKTDGTVTASRNIIIAGRKIKVEGPDPSVCLKLIGSGQTRRIRPDQLVVNNPSEIILLLPSLPAGTYRLEIVTQHTGSSILLKEPRVIRCDKDLVVTAATPAEEEVPAAQPTPAEGGAVATQPASDNNEASAAT